jgi:hypothetical protein
VAQRAEVRLVIDERLTGVGVRGDGADLDLGVSGEQAQDLASRVSGCAGDGDGEGHDFHLIVWDDVAFAATGTGGGDTTRSTADAGACRVA